MLEIRNYYKRPYFEFRQYVLSSYNFCCSIILFTINFYSYLHSVLYDVCQKKEERKKKQKKGEKRKKKLLCTQKIHAKRFYEGVLDFGH